MHLPRPGFPALAVLSANSERSTCLCLPNAATTAQQKNALITGQNT